MDATDGYSCNAAEKEVTREGGRREKGARTQ